MRLRFEVDQADCFRHGVDAVKSTTIVDCDPAKLTQPQRDLIADRLNGIDVCLITTMRNADRVPTRIIAKRPTFESLMEAIAADQKAVDAKDVA